LVYYKTGQYDQARKIIKSYGGVDTKLTPALVKLLADINAAPLLAIIR